MQKYLFICNNRFLYNREGAVKPYLAGQIRHREPRFGIASFPVSNAERIQLGACSTTSFLQADGQPRPLVERVAVLTASLAAD